MPGTHNKPPGLTAGGLLLATNLWIQTDGAY